MIALEPIDEEDVAAVAAVLKAEPRGDYAALGAQPGDLTPEQAALLIGGFIRVEAAAGENESHQFIKVGWGPLVCVDPLNTTFKLVMSFQAPAFRREFCQIMGGVVSDYCRQPVLDRIARLPDVSLDEVVEAMNRELRAYEDALVARGARTAAETFAWRCGVEFMLPEEAAAKMKALRTSQAEPEQLARSLAEALGPDFKVELIDLEEPGDIQRAVLEAIRARAGSRH